MKHIVVNLEMNNLAKNYWAEKMICKMETIEISAVVLDDTMFCLNYLRKT